MKEQNLGGAITHSIIVASIALRYRQNDRPAVPPPNPLTAS